MLCWFVAFLCTHASSLFIHAASLHIANTSFICRWVSMLFSDLHRDSSTWFAATSLFLIRNRISKSLRFVLTRSSKNLILPKRHFRHHSWRNKIAVIRFNSPKNRDKVTWVCKYHQAEFMGELCIYLFIHLLFIHLSIYSFIHLYTYLLAVYILRPFVFDKTIW